MQNIIQILRLTLLLQEPTGNWNVSAGESGGSMTDEEAFVFYNSTAWKRKRQEVLKLDRNECVICRSKGRYSKAMIVHHVKHLKDYPELALSVYDGEFRQLVSLCKSCHEDMHPEAQRQYKNKSVEPLTEERWD